MGGVFVGIVGVLLFCLFDLMVLCKCYSWEDEDEDDFVFMCDNDLEFFFL